MLKILLLVVFQLCTLCIVSVGADITCPIEWKKGKKKRGKDKDKFDGSCQFTMEQGYDAGDVTLNVTFDGEIDKFYAPKDWRSTQQSTGNWYYCTSKKKIENGKSVDIKFEVKMKKSKGPIRRIAEKMIKGAVDFFRKFAKKKNGGKSEKGKGKWKSTTEPPDGICALSFSTGPISPSTSTSTSTTPTTTSTTPTITSSPRTTTSTTPTTTSTTPTTTSTTPTTTSTTPTTTSTTPTTTSTTPTTTSTTPTTTSTTPTTTSTTPSTTSTTPTTTSTTPTTTSTTPTTTSTTPTTTSTTPSTTFTTTTTTSATPTTTSTTSTTTSTTPNTTSITPNTTSTTPTTTSTTQAPTTTEKDCSIPVEYGNNKWMNQGKYFARGQCDFSFDTFVPTGDFQVNVTFDSAISTYTDYNTMNLVSSDPGNWYFSESKYPFNPNQDFLYAFEISWLTGDFPPAKCNSNLDC